MTNVYIITEHGEGYTSAGMDFVADRLKKKFNIEDKLIFFTGDSLNTPDNLIAMLQKQPDSSAVVVSEKDCVSIISDPEDIKNIIIPLLACHANKPCWDTLVKHIHKSEN